MNLVLQNILPKLDLDSSFSGTRFRPLSLELPKPLFPIGGFPVVYHHIEACVKVQNEISKMSNALNFVPPSTLLILKYLVEVFRIKFK